MPPHWVSANPRRLLRFLQGCSCPRGSARVHLAVPIWRQAAEIRISAALRWKRDAHISNTSETGTRYTQAGKTGLKRGSGVVTGRRVTISHDNDNHFGPRDANAADT